MSKPSPFNLKRFAQRQEGIPNTFQPDRRRDPYRRPNPLKGEGKDMVTPFGEGSVLGPPDLASNALGQNQRESPLGAPLTGISQYEDPADNVYTGENELPDGKQEEGSPFSMRPRYDGEGHNSGSITEHGLLGHGDDIGTGTGNVAAKPGTGSPLGVHETVQKQMDGTADKKNPYNNMRNTDIFGLVRRKTR